jgi:hypothetical protein
MITHVLHPTYDFSLLYGMLNQVDVPSRVSRDTLFTSVLLAAINEPRTLFPITHPLV